MFSGQTTFECELMIIINVNPVAFSIGPVSVAWYGIMLALAVITLVIWALFSVK